MSGGYSKFFSGREHQISSLFQAQLFSAELILVTETTLGGSGGMLPQKKFETLRTVIVILALFKQFSDKVCSHLWPLTLSASSNMMHFVSTVSIVRA